MAFGIGLALLIGGILGWIPARAAMQAGGSAAGGASVRHTRSGHRRLRASLVIAQVALALVLLVCSGLLLRSMGRLLDVPLGLEPEGLLTMQVQATGRGYSDDRSADRFFAEALDAVRRVPGVRAAALTSQLPLSGDLDLYGARLDPPLEVDPGEERGTFRYAVSPGYLELMGIPLRRGRLLETADRAGTARVAVISESFARRRLPGQDPVGLRLRLGDQGPFTIVGVVGDVRQESLALDDADAVYLMVDQWANAESAMSLVVRGAGEVPVLAAAVRQAVWSVDPGLPVVRQAEMTALVRASAAERRFAMVIFQCFALAALVLAATGLYGVLAGTVAERTREIGVRAALGASRGHILALVVRQGMTMAGVGVVIGLAGALAATTAIGAMLFGIPALDPVTWVAVTGLLGAVALVACLVPAWRAVRVPPATPLRAE
jgi:predicted permease